MQYQVPQFIDVEDKIVGPLTLKQFFWVAAAFLIDFLAFFTLRFFIWIIFASIVAIVAMMFAFFKYNGRPFSTLLLSLFRYFWRPRRYTWQKAPVRLPGASNLEDKNLRLSTFIHPLRGERAFTLPFLQKSRSQKERFQVFRKATGERDVARRIDYR